jgi:hypothetical protein
MKGLLLDWAPAVMAWWLVLQLALIGIWDVYCYLADVPTATVTAVVQGWVKDIPMLAIAIGVILGHLFFPTRPPPVK